MNPEESRVPLGQLDGRTVGNSLHLAGHGNPEESRVPLGQWDGRTVGNSLHLVGHGNPVSPGTAGWLGIHCTWRDTGDPLGTAGWVDGLVFNAPGGTRES